MSVTIDGRRRYLYADIGWTSAKWSWREPICVIRRRRKPRTIYLRILSIYVYLDLYSLPRDTDQLAAGTPICGRCR